MSGLRIEVQSPVVPSAPNRADVACFVGFVQRRDTPVSPAVRRWLEERGWAGRSGAPRAGAHERSAADIDALLQVPVPIDGWDAFDHHFAWERRDLDGRGFIGDSYLGAAVRSFFLHGGRRCYVVRVSDPPAAELAEDDPEQRALRMALRLETLLPGFAANALEESAMERSTWRSIGHVHGLPDVSFLCLPDLPDAVAAPRPEPPPAPPEPRGQERFVVCAAPEPAQPVPSRASRLAAPVCDDVGFSAWARAVRLIMTLGPAVRREVQLVTAVPLPAPDAVALEGLARVHAADDLLRYLEAGGTLPGPGVDLRCPHDAFVQLCFPWLRSRVSGRLPGALEPPDGALTGILARTALTRGAFRSAAGTRAEGIVDVFPVVPRARLETPNDPARPDARALPERISIFAPTPAGFALLSDVTTSADPVCRSAAVKRLLAIVVRAARRLGEESVFEANGETLWARLRDGLNDLLLALLREGALRGRSPQDAFDVRCDRSTMTQQDLDQGRVVCEIRIQPSVSIEQITVVLALEDGGQVSLAASAGVLEAA
jgi:hypothetical protein